MKTKLLIFLLVIISLSCSVSFQGSPVVSPTIQATLTTAISAIETQTQPQSWTAIVQRATINVRNKPDGNTVVGYLSSGDTVEILGCDGNWCQIKEPNGWVFRGCLSDNPDDLDCRAR